jgi:hypothetical protein
MLLLIGWRLRVVSMMSGLLLLAFAVAMAFSLGVKAPLDYSVPSAAGAAILLASRDPDRFMLDAQLGPKRLSTLH